MAPDPGAFALHAVWVATGALSRPEPARSSGVGGPMRRLLWGATTERTCSAVMAAGMAVMAGSL